MDVSCRRATSKCVGGQELICPPQTISDIDRIGKMLNHLSSIFIKRIMSLVMGSSPTYAEAIPLIES